MRDGVALRRRGKWRGNVGRRAGNMGSGEQRCANRSGDRGNGGGVSACRWLVGGKGCRWTEGYSEGIDV